jgi:ubiquinone/menaquinone biosynthesis C-methylase UbiE
MARKAKREKHFPLFVHDNLFRRLFGRPGKYSPYVKQGQTVADLGCGPGFYTLALAMNVGAEGRVYAVDSDKKAVRALEKKAAKYGYHNIKTYACSAADLQFIEDESVDFILADGLLCSMAPQGRESAVGEMKRILKPDGKAFLSAAKDAMSNISKAEWEKVLEGFRVEEKSEESFFEDRWALVSKKRQ